MKYLVDNTNQVQAKYYNQKIHSQWSVFDDSENQITDTHNNGLPIWKVVSGLLVKATDQDFSPHPEYQLSLSELKSKLIFGIDQKTQELIFAGFAHGGKRFSMSANAQINWLGLETLAGNLTYPYTISTKFDEDFQLNDANDARTLTQSAKTHKEIAIVSGRSEKNKVNAMQTIDQLKMHNDSR